MGRSQVPIPHIDLRPTCEISVWQKRAKHPAELTVCAEDQSRAAAVIHPADRISVTDDDDTFHSVPLRGALPEIVVDTLTMTPCVHGGRASHARQQKRTGTGSTTGRTRGVRRK